MPFTLPFSRETLPRCRQRGPVLGLLVGHASRFASQDRLDLLVGELVALVREEVTELGLTRLADRLRKRDRRLRGTADLLHLRDRHLQLESDLGRTRLPAILRPHLTLGAEDPV